MADNYVTGGDRYDGTTNPGPNTSEREDLANFISMITRDETPFLSSIGKTKATSVFHEWQTDELRDPATNSQAEGSDIATQTFAADSEYRTRLGNYTQIFTEDLQVSGTKRVVDQAGIADEYAYQLKKKGTELRRDVEFALVHNWQDSASGRTRTLGSVTNWASQGLVVDATLNTGAGGIVEDAVATATTFETVFRTDGNGTLAADLADGLTEVDVELSHIDEVMQAIYEEGGKATKVMTSPRNRRTISAKANANGAINTRRNIDEKGSLRASVDMYMSDFGDVMIVPNYIMGLSNVVGRLGDNNAANFSALVYDPMWFNTATLRPLQEVEVGQLGDSTRGMIVEECTLEVRNPKGFGLIVGIGA